MNHDEDSRDFSPERFERTLHTRPSPLRRVSPVKESLGYGYLFRSTENSDEEGKAAAMIEEEK